MNCIHCGTVKSAKTHDSFCPYNPINLLKIANYCKQYVEQESSFGKELKPFPDSKELDCWLRVNGILSVKTIRKHYFDGSDMKVEDWLSSLISYGLDNSVLDEELFPIYILYIWDTWLFKSREEYMKSYRMAMEYENGDYPLNLVLDFDKLKFELEGT